MMLDLLLIPLAGVLWYLGGCGNDCTKQGGLLPLNKAWRRIVWPVIAATMAEIALSLPLWYGLVFGIALCTVNSLGYGETVPWWRRAVVGFCLGLPVMMIQPILTWPIVMWIAFGILYWLSNKYNWMNWSVVEAIVGATQAACIVLALRG
jgi:hypothetical protein